MKNILEVDDICKKYKNFSLEHITFQLPAGYIMGYVGQNGSGKTTTLGVITNCLKASSGSVMIDGKTAANDEVAYKESIGFIGDELYFPYEFYIRDVRSSMKDFYPSFEEEKFNAMVRNWNLPEKKKVGEFSRGMKVQLMFASVFSRKTKLMILDEATNGLDPVVRREILGLIQEYIMDGERSVLFSTHIMDDLEQIADYIFFIHDGKKVMFDQKEILEETYCLVKGGVDELTADAKAHLIGVIKTAVGFEALTERANCGKLPTSFRYEKPNIDEIVVHYIRQMCNL